MSWTWETPDIARLEELHADGIRRYGGSDGTARGGCLDGARGAAINGAAYASDDGEDPHPLMIAALLLFYLVNDHCFTDGNKRIGWAAMVDMLDSFGVGIDATVEEAYQFVDGITKGTIDRDAAVRWVVDRAMGSEFDA